MRKNHTVLLFLTGICTVNAATSGCLQGSSAKTDAGPRKASLKKTLNTDIVKCQTSTRYQAFAHCKRVAH